MRRAILSAFVLCSLCFGGCMFPYCAYPALDYTPQVKIDAPPAQVRAFRVDISKPTGDMSLFRGPIFEYLSEIPVTNTDEIPAQIRPSVSYGFVVIGVALNYLTHTSYSVALRVYRPGYELVEIRSWEQVNRVVWKAVSDIDAQEKALDGLFIPDRLERGSKWVAHRAALTFGAGEYDRLAGAAESVEQRARLAKKAATLRERAEQ